MWLLYGTEVLCEPMDSKLWISSQAHGCDFHARATYIYAKLFSTRLFYRATIVTTIPTYKLQINSNFEDGKIKSNPIYQKLKNHGQNITWLPPVSTRVATDPLGCQGDHLEASAQILVSQRLSTAARSCPCQYLSDEYNNHDTDTVKLFYKDRYSQTFL